MGVRNCYSEVWYNIYNTVHKIRICPNEGKILIGNLAGSRLQFQIQAGGGRGTEGSTHQHQPSYIGEKDKVSEI